MTFKKGTKTKCAICGTVFEMQSPHHLCCSTICSNRRARAMRKKRKESAKVRKDAQLVETTVKAKSEGMTYGQYVASANRPEIIKKATFEPVKWESIEDYPPVEAGKKWASVDVYIKNKYGRSVLGFCDRNTGKYYDAYGVEIIGAVGWRHIKKEG